MTTLTVTATQTAATSNGLLLRVKVLTNTAAVQNGATVASSTALNGNIVTTVTGSLVYGALSGDSAAGAFVAEPSCTLIDNFLDSTNAERYGSFVTTSPTGTPGSTLVGSTTANANRDMAAVEILPNGTITEDASGPAVATATGAITVTSASFTPPPGSLLVAIVGSDGAASGTPTTMSVTDTGGGLTWTQVVFANSASTCYAGVWLAQVPGSAVTPNTWRLQPGGKAWKRKNRRPQTRISGPAPSPDLTVSAGLATAAGAAADFSTGLIAGLTVNAVLATGTGTAQPPVATISVNAGLATGTGTSQPPGITFIVNAGLATGTGTSQPPVSSITVNAALATGTGTAQPPTIIAPASNAGLATGTGTAFSPTVTLTVNAGLATATGNASQPGTPRSIALATGTGTAQQPTVTVTVNAGLATGTGTAFAPGTPRSIGLATGTGTAQQPSITLTAGLAHGTGTAQSPSASLTVNAGLATGTGTAQPPTAVIKVIAGLATGTGTAFNVTSIVFARPNVNYTGSTLTNPNTLGGTVSVAALGGTASVNANTLGGTASVNTNTLGGTLSVFTLGGTAAVTSDTLTGTLSVVVNALSGTDVTDKMQEVDITLNEFNDATVTFQILNNGSPDNITGMTVNALFKKTRGDLDSAGTTKTYSSGGGSPAITIVTPSTGSCTLAIPDADVIFPNWTFYRIDVVNGSVTTTAIFGTVTITQL